MTSIASSRVRRTVARARTRCLIAKAPTDMAAAAPAAVVGAAGDDAQPPTPQPETILKFVSGRELCAVSKRAARQRVRVPEADTADVDGHADQLPWDGDSWAMRCQLSSSRDHPRPVACARTEAVRIRQVRVHVLRALDAVEREDDLAVRRNAVAVDDRPHAPHLPLERGRACRADPHRCLQSRNLRDRRSDAVEIDRAATGVAQGHQPPERPAAVRSRSARLGVRAARPRGNQCARRKKCECGDGSACELSSHGARVGRSAAEPLSLPAMRRCSGRVRARRAGGRAQACSRRARGR